MNHALKAGASYNKKTDAFRICLTAIFFRKVYNLTAESFRPLSCRIIQNVVGLVNIYEEKIEEKFFQDIIP